MAGQPLEFAAPEVLLEVLADGSKVLRSKQALAPYPDRVGDWLRGAARACPERVFLAERRGGAWTQISYAKAVRAVEGLGQSLLNLGLGRETPILALSGNSIGHALLALAAISQIVFG